MKLPSSYKILKTCFSEKNWVLSLFLSREGSTATKHNLYTILPHNNATIWWEPYRTVSCVWTYVCKNRQLCVDICVQVKRYVVVACNLRLNWLISHFLCFWTNWLKTCNCMGGNWVAWKNIICRDIFKHVGF